MRADALLLLLLLCLTAALLAESEAVARRRRRIVIRRRRLASNASIQPRASGRNSSVPSTALKYIKARTMQGSQKKSMLSRSDGVLNGTLNTADGISETSKGQDEGSYSYAFEVEDAGRGSLYRQEERRMGQTVDGQYDVLLPDNRIMSVTYSVNSTTGFQPKISFRKIQGRNTSSRAGNVDTVRFSALDMKDPLDGENSSTRDHQRKLSTTDSLTEKEGNNNHNLNTHKQSTSKLNISKPVLFGPVRATFVRQPTVSGRIKSSTSLQSTPTETVPTQNSTTTLQFGSRRNVMQTTVNSTASHPRGNAKRINDLSHESKLRYISRVQSRIMAALKSKPFAVTVRPSRSHTATTQPSSLLFTTTKPPLNSTTKTEAPRNTSIELSGMSEHDDLSQTDRTQTRAYSNLSDFVRRDKNIDPMTSTISSQRAVDSDTSTGFEAKINFQNATNIAAMPRRGSTGMESIIKHEVTGSSSSSVAVSRDLASKMIQLEPNTPGVFMINGNASLTDNRTLGELENLSPNDLPNVNGIHGPKRTSFPGEERTTQRPASWPGLFGSLLAYRFNDNATLPQETKNDPLNKMPLQTFQNFIKSTERILNVTDQPLNQEVASAKAVVDTFNRAAVDEGLSTASFRRVTRDYLNKNSSSSSSSSSNTRPPLATEASAILTLLQASTSSVSAVVTPAAMQSKFEKMNDKTIVEALSPNFKNLKNDTFKSHVYSSPFFRAFSTFPRN